MTSERANRLPMTLWLRRLCFVVLLASWVLAVGGHDWLLDHHDHEASSPEWVIAQVWHSDLASPPQPLATVTAIIVLMSWLIVKPLCLQQTVERSPESRQSRPRPPTLRNLLFRGPPALALLVRKVYEIGDFLCSNTLSHCSGWRLVGRSGQNLLIVGA